MKIITTSLALLCAFNLASMDNRSDFRSFLVKGLLDSKTSAQKLKPVELLQNSQSHQWATLVESCPLDIFLHSTTRNAALLNDPIVKERFLNIETKEKHKLTPQGLDYIINRAEKLRHNYDYEVTFEWSWKNLGFGYLIKNTGIDSSKSEYISINASGIGMTKKHLCDQLARVPYHKYGPMPTGSAEEWNAAIMTRANSYYDEKKVPLRISSCELINGVSNFTFQAKRSTPATIYFGEKGGVKITFADTTVEQATSKTTTEKSVSTDSASTGNLSSIDQLVYPETDIPNFPLTIQATASSSSSNQDAGSLFIAESTKILEGQRFEAERRANEHVQAIAFSTTRAQIKDEVATHLGNQGTNTLPEDLAHATRIANAMGRAEAKLKAELRGEIAPTGFSGLRSQWEENVSQLNDERFIAHYASSKEIREYTEFKDRMKDIISNAGDGLLKRLIQNDLSNTTCIEFWDTILQRAYQLGVEDSVEGHLKAMHDRIAGEPWFTLNPIQEIPVADQPALIYYFEQMQIRKKSLEFVSEVIKTATVKKKLSSKQKNNVFQLMQNNYNDPIFDRALKNKGYHKDIYRIARQIADGRISKFVRGMDSQNALKFALKVDKLSTIIKLDTKNANYVKLHELANTESMELTGMTYSQLRKLSKNHEISLEQLAQKFTDPLQQNLHKAIIKNINTIPTNCAHVASGNALARAALKLNKNNQIGKAETLSDYLSSWGLTLTEKVDVNSALSLPEKASKVIEIVTDTTLDLTDVLFGYFQHGERFLVDKYACAERMPLLADGKRRVGEILVEVHTGIYKAVRNTMHGLGYSVAKLVRDPAGLSRDIAYGAAEGMNKGIRKTAEFIHNEGMHGVAIDNEHMFPEWSQAIINDYFEQENTIYGLSKIAAEMTAEEWGSTIGHALIAHYGGAFAHKKLQPFFRKIRSAANASKTCKTLGEFTNKFKNQLKTRLDKLFPERIAHGLNEAVAEIIAKTEEVYGNVLSESEIVTLNLRDRKKTYIADARRAINDKGLIIPHDQSILPQIVEKRIDKFALLTDNPEMIIESTIALARNTKKINNLKIMLQPIPGFSDKALRLTFDLDHTFLIECDTRKVTGKAVNISGGHWTANGELNRIGCPIDPCRPKISKPILECDGYKLAPLEIDGILMNKSIFPDHFDIDMVSEVIIEAAQNLDYKNVFIDRNILTIYGTTESKSVIQFIINSSGYIKTQHPDVKKMIELASKG